MATKKNTVKTEALDYLRNTMKLVPGDTIFTNLRGVARSGMTRWIDLYVIREGEPLRITWHVAAASGYTYDEKREALKIGGCGMDMGFEAVYQLGYQLWPQGTPEPHGTRNGEPDNVGGYALKQRWM